MEEAAPNTMSSSGSNPRDFFETHVRPNYQAWLNSPLEEHLAKNAVAEANNMAERMYHHLSMNNPQLIFGAKKPSEYRDYLTESKCPDFALIRDVADAHKHLGLDRKSRRLTRDSQTNIETPGGMFPPSYFPPRYFSRGYFGPREQFVVTLDSGEKRPLSTIMKNVLEMWERLMDQAGE